MDIQIRKISWGVPENIHAFHTTRIGGVSKGVYKSSNLSYDVGDNPKNVKNNRRIIQKQLNLLHQPIFMKQIHSATIRKITKPLDTVVCDSCYTDVPGLPLAVLSADCLPILISNKRGTKVGVIHAGWRGLNDGVIEKFIQRFTKNPSELIVWIGPSINPDHYIVREDVFNKLSKISTKFFSKTDDLGSWYLDLKLVAKIILKGFGIKEIFLDSICTHENSNLYYSYRRQNVTGRIASLIWIGQNDSED